MGAAFIAIGLFYSSLTDNQIVAAVLTLMTLLLFLLLNWVSSLGSGAAWSKVVTYLSFSEHFEDMTRGIIDTKDVVYYLSVSFFGLFLAHSVLQSRRWR
jgi:ABC-2 type transport system permease protein